MTNFFDTYSDLAGVCYDCGGDPEALCLGCRTEASRDPFHEAAPICLEAWASLPAPTIPAVQAAQHKEPLFNFVFDANKHLTTAIGARTVPTEKEAELCT